ncbi:MAG TPA: hypothetical protein VGD95_08250, partial [Micavibrio sp.]
AQSAADVAGSPAMRVYESTMMECFKTVMNVDPAAAALSKNKAALNMDKKHFTRLQDCMSDKGVPVNFENYYSEGNKEGLSAAQRADLQAIQDSLNSGRAPSPAASASASAATTTSPTTTTPPGMTIIRATPEVAAPAEADDAGAGTPVKPQRAPDKYWVTPE